MRNIKILLLLRYKSIWMTLFNDIILFYLYWIILYHVVHSIKRKYNFWYYQWKLFLLSFLDHLWHFINAIKVLFCIDGLIVFFIFYCLFTSVSVLIFLWLKEIIFSLLIELDCDKSLVFIAFYKYLLFFNGLLAFLIRYSSFIFSRIFNWLVVVFAASSTFELQNFSYLPFDFFLAYRLPLNSFCFRAE